MKWLKPASVAVFALCGGILLTAPTMEAQIHGTPTSVTSTGFGGHFERVPGTRTSVTSLGPQGYGNTNQFNPQNCCINPLFPVNPNPSRGGGNRQRHHRPISGGLYAVPYPVYVTDPYLQDSGEQQAQEPMDPRVGNYTSGPTIFDRRASDVSSQAAEAAFAEHMRNLRQAEPAAPREQPAVQQAPAAPEPDQPLTVLVFKDGHQTEVRNYAIVGSMLYDMTPGHRNKIAVADLDLTATAKQNDERGISFQLPAKPVAN